MPRSRVEKRIFEDGVEVQFTKKYLDYNNIDVKGHRGGVITGFFKFDDGYKYRVRVHQTKKQWTGYNRYVFKKNLVMPSRLDGFFLPKKEVEEEPKK